MKQWTLHSQINQMTWTSDFEDITFLLLCISCHSFIFPKHYRGIVWGQTDTIVCFKFIIQQSENVFTCRTLCWWLPLQGWKASSSCELLEYYGLPRLNFSSHVMFLSLRNCNFWQFENLETSSWIIGTFIVMKNTPLKQIDKEYWKCKWIHIWLVDLLIKFLLLLIIQY